MTRSTGGDAEPAAPFPWRAMIAHGLLVLRLDPDAFWRLTPRELVATLGEVQHPAPAHDDLVRLMQAFPDP